ncbi:MAG: hypothetical protein M3N32_05320 [Actinomycetota bacterium]|nr:hypothetical protein [Actinomycetota bacterium]
MYVLLDLLPVLDLREAWAVGLVLVFALLRPVGRLGWTAAALVLTAAVAAVGEMLWGVQATGNLPPGLPAYLRPEALPWASIMVGAWIALAALLAATGVVRPLRWEPRTGPGAATALLIGAFVLHFGAAGHTTGAIGAVAGRWGAGALTPGGLGVVTSGPLAWPLTWLLGAVPLLGPKLGAALVGLVAVAIVVVGADRLGRRWGYVGTARCTAAAVAWSPPLLLAHLTAPAAVLATAALVTSWWALVEVWGGRHRPGRLAFISGLLLGIAVGVALWPLVVAPLWLRRLGMRTAGWFVVGFGVAALASVLALVPTTVGFNDVWGAAVAEPLHSGLAPPEVAVTVALLVVATLVLRRPLSPTRLSAVTAALLLATLPWWPDGAATTGPVAAIPFVLLAAVAPDRPQERWPPDAPVPVDAAAQVGV